MREIWFCIGLFLLPVLGQAQQVLKGQLLDGNLPLVGANVFLQQHPLVGTSTDTAGYFTLQIPEAYRTDSLVLSYIGYREKVLALVPLLRESPVSLQLEEMAGTLSEVTVKATALTAAEFALQKMTPIEIYTQPASKADPLLAVKQLAASTGKDESAALSFRGAAPQQTGYFINGMRVYDPVRYSQLNGDGTLSIFNTGFIKSVEVFTGNPPLELGRATSGIVNIETTEQITESTQQNMVLSLASSGYSVQTPLNKKLQVGAFVNYQRDELLKALNPNAFDDLKGFESTDAGVSAVWKSKAGLWKWYSYALGDSYDYAYHHPSYDSTLHQSSTRQLHILQWQQKWKALALKSTLGLSAHRKHFQFGNMDYKTRDENWQANISAQYTRPKSQYTVGLSMMQRKTAIEGALPVLHYALAPWHPTYQAHQEAKSFSPEVFAYARFFPTEDWEMGTGLRKDLNRGTLNWQVNLKKYGSKNSWLLLGLGHYSQQLQSEQKGFENTSSFQLTLNGHKAWRKLTAEACLYHNAYAKVTYNGAELDLAWNPFSDWHLRGTWSLYQADSLHASLELFQRYSLEYSPSSGWNTALYFIQFGGGTYHPLRGAHYEKQWQVYQPFYQNTIRQLSAYQSLSWSLSRIFALNENLTLISFLNVSNILNRKNERAVQYNYNYVQSGRDYFSERTIYFGVSINFTL